VKQSVILEGRQASALGGLGPYAAAGVGVANAMPPLSGVACNARGTHCFLGETVLASWCIVYRRTLGAAATLPAEEVELAVLIGDSEKKEGSTDVSKKTMPITAAIVLIARIVEAYITCKKWFCWPAFSEGGGCAQSAQLRGK